MQRSKTSGSTKRQSAAERVAEELRIGAALIAKLDPEVYALGKDGKGSIGAHIRHNLDFVERFIQGTSAGLIDYSARGRSPEIESDAAAALGKIGELAGALLELALGETVRIAVRSEADPDAVYESTVGRELEFLHSHTIHHYALIAERIRALGIETDEGFGVAPSTLRFWKGEAASGG